MPDGWNQCFLCSIQLEDGGRGRGEGGTCDDEKTKNDTRKGRNVVITHWKILLKYLLNDPRITKSASEKILQLVSQQSQGEGDDAFFQFCGTCQSRNELLAELQLQLDTVQMKLVELLQVMRGSMGSFGKRRRQGGTTVGVKLLEIEQDNNDVADQFQRLVSENDQRRIRVPLVYLEKYTGQMGPWSSSPSSSVYPDPSKPQQQLIETEEIPRSINPIPEDDFSSDSGSSGSGGVSFESGSNNYYGGDDDAECANSNNVVSGGEIPPSSPASQKKTRHPRKHARVIQQTEKEMSFLELDKHLVSDHNNTPKQYKCDKCPGTSYSSPTALSNHRRAHHHKSGSGTPSSSSTASVKRFFCSKCPWRFPTRSKLVRHEATHAETKDFTCEQCGFATKTERQMTHHLQVVHSPSGKRHKCSVCSKLFASKNGLVLHLRTHTGEKPYQCEECGRAFSQKPPLVRHLKSKHNK